MARVNGLFFEMNINLSYREAINHSMKMIAKQKNSIFIGQSVVYPGNLIYKTLEQINDNKKIELPVFEEVQTGLSIGLAMNGLLPITTYPRFDFFLLGFNQLINHLDKMFIISKGEFNPKVIVRVLVGAKKPLDAGEQHTQNYVKPLKLMCKRIKIYDLKSPKKVLVSYQKAIKSTYSSVMVEYSEKF